MKFIFHVNDPSIRSSGDIRYVLLMTREAGVAYKSIKYELCTLKAEYTSFANEFTTTVFFDVNR